MLRTFCVYFYGKKWETHESFGNFSWCAPARICTQLANDGSGSGGSGDSNSDCHLKPLHLQRMPVCEWASLVCDDDDAWRQWQGKLCENACCLFARFHLILRMRRRRRRRRGRRGSCVDKQPTVRPCTLHSQCIVHIYAWQCDGVCYDFPHVQRSATTACRMSIYICIWYMGMWRCLCLYERVPLCTTSTTRQTFLPTLNISKL